MQRVIRDPEASQDGLAALEGKVALIRQHFPPSVANLYAIPRQGSGGVLEWWSELTGQPLRLCRQEIRFWICVSGRAAFRPVKPRFAVRN